MNVWVTIAAAGTFALSAVGIMAAIWRVARVGVPAVEALMGLRATTDRMDLRAAAMEQQQAEILGHMKHQAEKQKELHDYMHDSIHAIRGGLSTINTRDATVHMLADRLATVANQLTQVRGRDATGNG